MESFFLVLNGEQEENLSPGPQTAGPIRKQRGSAQSKPGETENPANCY